MVIGALSAGLITPANAKSPEATACDESGPQYALEERIAACTALIAQDPKNAAALYNRGYAYDHKGQYDLAIADYTHAIALKPNYADAFINRTSPIRMTTDTTLESATTNKH